MNTRFFTSSLLFLLCLFKAGQASAQTLPPNTDWFTVAGNYARTSWVSTEVPGFQSPEWFYPIPSYISQRIHPIATKDATGKDTLYVAAADGVYAFDPAAVQFNSSTREATSGIKWHYQTSLPAGNSPTVVNGIVYFPGMDKKVHAIKDNGSNYQLLWTSPEAGAGFQSNPIVVNNAVYAGNRDGAVYAFDLSTGSQLWKYQTGGPIFQSIAYDAGVIYVASNDMYVYAINATNGALIWRSDADPSTPEKDKFPGPMFQSYWPVVYNYNDQKYVIFVRIFDITQTHTDSGDLYDPYKDDVDFIGYNDVCKRNQLTSGTLLHATEIADQTWMHGFPKMSLSSHIRYLDDTPETYITSQNATTCVVNSTEVANRNYRRVYFMVNAQTGQEYQADLEGSGISDDHFPFTLVGGKAGSPYPPLIGQDNVLYARNNYIVSPAIGRGGLVGWVPGSNDFSIPAGNWAIDEPSAFAAGGNYIHEKLMAERSAHVFRYTASPSQSVDYWGQGGDGYLSYRIPELFRQGWHYGYWKSGDQSPMIPFRGKVYALINNALVQFGTQGAPKQYTWDSPEVDDIVNKTTGTPINQLEGPLKIIGVFSHATATASGWPVLHQQESYLDLRPDQDLNADPMNYFNPFTIVGHPTNNPTTAVTASSYTPTLSTNFSGGTLTVQTSPITPAILINQTYSYVKLQGSIVGLAYPNTPSTVSVVTNPSTIVGSILSQGWFLVWDNTEDHRWFPFVVTLENRPTSITLDPSGVTLIYPTSAGRFTLTPYNGMSHPLPGKGPTYFANDRSNIVLERWQTGDFTSSEISQAQTISTLSRVFPAQWSESFSFTTQDATINQTYSNLIKFSFDGATTPADIAFIPPMTTLAAWENPQIQINNSALSAHLDPIYPLPFGRWAAVPNTASLEMFIPGVPSVWNQALPTPPSPSDNDPLKIRLDQETSSMISAGHLRPYRMYYGILQNLDNRSGEGLFQYYHNPADTVSTLRQSMPLISTTDQAPLTAYINAESSDPYLLSSIVHTGYLLGSRRENHLPLPDFERIASPTSPTSSFSWGSSTGATIWTYSPKSIYALYQNGTSTAFSQINSSKLANPFTANLFRVSTPYVLNNYLAGYLGYIKLGALAGQNTDVQKQILTQLLIMRLALTNNPASLAQTGFEYGNYEWIVQAYRPDTGEITFHTNQIGTQWSQYTTYGYKYDRIYFRSGGATGGGYTFTIDYLDLPKEVGIFMRQHVLAKVAEQVTVAERMAPYWFMAHAPEAAGEVTLQPLHDTVALLNAKAYILNEPRAALEKYLDVPAVKTGDLFYLHKLNLVLSAPGGSTITPNPTPASPNTDLDNDSDTDWFDLSILIGYFNQIFSPGNFNLTGLVDIFDFNTLIQNL